MENSKFDLDRALAGDPVVTRNGKKVLQIFVFDKYNEVYKVVAFIEDRGLHSYSIHGSHWHNGQLDLFMLPKKTKVYIGINKNKNEKLGLYETTCAFINKDDTKSIDYKIYELEIEVD